MARIPIAQELSQQITFKSLAGARNAVTGLSAAPVTVTTAWARITDLGGDVENVTQQESVCRQRYEIWIRHDSSVTAFQEILWGSLKLTIVAPPQKIIDENNRWWTVITAECADEE